MPTPLPPSPDEQDEGPDRLLGDTKLFAVLVGLALLLLVLPLLVLVLVLLGGGSQ